MIVVVRSIENLYSLHVWLHVKQTLFFSKYSYFTRVYCALFLRVTTCKTFAKMC